MKAKRKEIFGRSEAEAALPMIHEVNSARRQELLEAEGLRLLYEYEQSGKEVKHFTIAHGLAVRKFYQKLLDQKAKCGLVLEGNHP